MSTQHYHNSTFKIKPGARTTKRAPIKCNQPISRSTGLRTRRQNKKQTVDGDLERDIRDECDELIRQILKKRDHQCISSGCDRVRGLEVGHFIKRGVLSLRWDLRNCHRQCPDCNVAHNTNRQPYREAMLFIYGKSTVLGIEQQAERNPGLQYIDLLAIRDNLREELRKYKNASSKT